MPNTIKQSNGNKIWLTLPIPSFKSLRRIRQANNQIKNTETSTLGTMLNNPESESVACKTLFAKYKSGFDPHAFVMLKTI